MKGLRLDPLLVASPRRVVGMVAAAIVVASAGPVVAVAPQWWGWMPGTLGTFLSATVWGSPVIAASAAWVGGALRRSRMHGWVSTTPRGLEGAYREPVRVCGLLGCVVYTALWVGMVGATLARSQTWSPGSTHLVLVWPLAMASAWAWAGLGVLVGRTMPAGVALPAAVILGYVAYLVPVYYWSESPLLALAATDGRRWDYLQPTVGQSVAKVALWCAIAWLASVAARSMQHRFVIAAWASSLTMGVSLFVGSALAPISHATDRLCTRDVPVVCTDFAHAPVLPNYQRAAKRALSVLPRELWPQRLDAGPAAPPGSLPVGPVNGFTDPALVLDEKQFTERLGQAVFAECPGSVRGAPASQVGLLAWWYVRHDLDMSSKPGPNQAPWVTVPSLTRFVEQGRRLAATSTAAQQNWFVAHLTDIKACTLSEAAWP